MKVIVANKEYSGFKNYRIVLKYNALASAFSFSGMSMYQPDIMSFPEVQIFDKGDLLLTGNVLAPQLYSQASPRPISFNGYSTPGILEDVSIPVGLYPLQFDRMTLREIADKVLGYFNIDYLVDPGAEKEMDARIQQVSSNPGQSVYQVLRGITNQRQLILTHDVKGRLIFTGRKVNTSNIIDFTDQKAVGIKSMSLDVNARRMSSSITVMRQATPDNPNAGQATILNPYFEKDTRPTVQTLNSGSIFDVEKAARLALSSQLTNIQLTILTTRTIMPGSVLEIVRDDLKIYSPHQFFVQETVIEKPASGMDTYELTCVPVDAYTDNVPKNIFK